MYTRYLILLFLAAARCQQGGDIDTIKQLVFPTTPKVPELTTPIEQQNRTLCLTEDKQVGECIPYYLCASQNTVITDGDGLIDIRVTINEKCPSYLETCCLMNQTQYMSTTVKPNINQTEIKKCGDGSDDTGGVCDPKNDSDSPVPSAPNSECILPPYPEHGTYVANIRNAKPGQKYDSFQINVTCNRGYGVVGDASMICFVGGSITKMPECVPICKLNKHASVEYYCLVTGVVTGTRICNQYEPSNTQVLPECKKPNYYSHNYLPQMRCIEGSWNYVATCEAECGRITPGATKLVIGGKLAKRGEMPWHAGIYTKTTDPYRQICGGTLVSTTVVISAAHCFWADDGEMGQLPESQFAVALGKIYRPWNDPVDIGAQKFDVKEIKLPTKFRGNAANFQEDIALVTLSAEVELQTHIRPVCLSFDPYFNQRQLQHQNLGKMCARWLILLFVAVAKCQQQQVDPSVIRSIWKTTTTPNFNDTNIPCITEDKKNGQCVPYYLCENNRINKDGTALIDIRLADGPCPSYMDTCCLDGDTSEPPTTQEPTISEPERVGCGWRNPNGVGFVAVGVTQGETQFGEFPWMVAVISIVPVNEDEPNGELAPIYKGGGSLIHPSVVLTAAHVVAGVKTLQVKAGEWDTQNTKEPHPFQQRNVKSHIVHEDYMPGILFYDVALLFLDQPMNMAPNVGVVCLPPAKKTTPSGTSCFASGWGKDKFGREGQYQVILKKVELPVMDDWTCLQRLRQTRLGKLFELHSSFMCAGGVAGQDTCKGDGGSPLVCPIEYEAGRYMQTGIVAWGIGCGQNGIPGVYVDVAHVRAWIDGKIQAQNYQTSVYTI